MKDLAYDSSKIREHVLTITEKDIKIAEDNRSKKDYRICHECLIACALNKHFGGKWFSGFTSAMDEESDKTVFFSTELIRQREVFDKLFKPLAGDYKVYESLS